MMAALTAENQVLQVTLFLEEDGVNILNCKTAGAIFGKVIEDLYEHLEN